MAEKNDNMGAVTHQLSAVDDDMQKTANVKEANVASVALGELFALRYDRYRHANTTQPLLSRQRSQSSYPGT
jgi:hypothetical protein